MTATATEIKNFFGRFLRRAETAPVFIEKNHSVVAVIVSKDEFDRLSRIEDMFWSEKAAKAEREGYIGEPESLKVVERGEHAKA
jgi:prevent-host-death family protein